MFPRIIAEIKASHEGSLSKAKELNWIFAPLRSLPDAALHQLTGKDTCL
ncbi:hypothetical protein [Treponema sp.]|nr:hypothetical protein [Treponema sp.]